jgi:hypothetical protein
MVSPVVLLDAGPLGLVTIPAARRRRFRVPDGFRRSSLPVRG